MPGAASLSRLKAALFLLAALMLASPAAAFAQGNVPPGPAQGQYQDDASAAADAGDIPPALTNNVTDGSEPVNKALSEPGVPPAAAKELESLPETGGAPSASLLAVAPLVLLLPLVVAARFALRAPLSARR